MNQRPKIIIFSLAYEPFIGGAEVAIKEITNRLASYFEFDLITANLDGRQKKEEMIGAVKVYRVGRGQIGKYLFPWLAYRRAVSLASEKKYNLIWAMMANQAGWAALKFKKQFPRMKYLLTLQEGDSEFDIWLRTFFIRPLYKNIYRRADYLQAISNYLAARARKMGAKCPIEIVPNGVKVQSGIGDGTQKKNSQNIITVSRLVKKNGVEDLIKSIALLVNNNQSPVNLTIIGDGVLRLQLEKLAQDLKIRQQVEFIGQVANRKVYEYLSQARVFVRPSLSEGLGNAFLEAMSCGVPVIGTPVGGIPDFLKEGETGWFCEVRNPESIAEKIKYILDEKNKVEVERVINNAYKLVSEKYNWNKISIEFEIIINKLLQNL